MYLYDVLLCDSFMLALDYGVIHACVINRSVISYNLQVQLKRQIFIRLSRYQSIAFAVRATRLFGRL